MTGKRKQSTLKERRLDGTSSLLDTSTAIDAVTRQLNNACEHLNAGHVGKAKTLLRQVTRANSVAAATLRKNATMVNDEPSAMLQYVARSIEVSQRRAMHGTEELKDRSILNAFIAENKENIKPAAKRSPNF